MISRKGTSHLLLIAGVILLSTSVSSPNPIFVYTSEPLIRVCLQENVSRVSIHLTGAYVLDYQGIRIARTKNSDLTFRFSEDGTPVVVLSNQEVRFLSPVTIAPDSGDPHIASAGADGIKVGQGIYPGSMEVVPAGDGTYRLINVVPLETYLRGVVPNELVGHPTGAELQACMAQAIAARNYAFFRMSNVDSSDRYVTRSGFDVYSDTRDQVYSGMQRYNSLSDSAISLTDGMIVEYKGEPARCFFHSTCGGHTENVQNVWQGQPPQPYLQGVSDFDTITVQSFCVYSPQFYWTTTFTGAELHRMLVKNLALANPMYVGRPIIGRISSLKVVNRFESFRVDTLEIRMTNGDIYYVRGDRTRYLFKSANGALLRSSLFKINVVKGPYGVIRKIVINGQGSGHGVGMCQWGAIGMSRLGYSYKQILVHYFPGTEIKKVY